MVENVLKSLKVIIVEGTLLCTRRASEIECVH
jgi:hypothetical protein